MGHRDISDLYRIFNKAMLFHNPVCQHTVGGQRCTRKSETWHHFISPKDCPELVVNELNGAALCFDCHKQIHSVRPNVSGDPDKGHARALAAKYAPTNFCRCRETHDPGFVESIKTREARHHAA